jgi:uncharacterized membrane protein YgcG/tetratricopeptide (TPR) repeat protein
MKQSNSQRSRVVIVLALSFTVFFSTLVAPPVYAQEKVPAPATHVSDTAGVVPEATRQQLENILTNLQQRSGVNFMVQTVQSTGGVELYDYSAKLAREWNVGLLASTSKSLLLVIAIDEKISGFQASKAVRRDFPEGLLANVVDQMRAPISTGRVTEALLLAVQKIVAALSGKLGFNADGMDQPATAEAKPEATAAQSPGEAKVSANSEAQLSEPKVERPDPKPQSDPESQLSDSKPAKADPVTRKRPAVAEPGRTSSSAKKSSAPDDEAEAAFVVERLADPIPARIEKLKNFIATHPDSKSKVQATEYLIAARAALGDEKLKAGDSAAGVELLYLALRDFIPEMSDKLFAGVISRIPLNLYLRGQATESLKAARELETKIADNPKRLQTLSGFYREIERGDDAARVAEQAVKLAPDLAEAHNALALALHISLRLDEATTEYKRALELDPKMRGGRRALADLDRAAGKFDEALVLYREQLAVAADDKLARVGLVICLFEVGKLDEAKEELKTAIDADPRNLQLLTGAAYWLLAHGESTLALALAQKAVNIEPRYTWAQITLSRSLLAQKEPLYAERSIRYARQYGKFPTLDYELASTLASMGLYEEASEALLASFTLKDGQLETQLANRIPARATSFIELLALERRASIFQPVAADTEDNSRILKALLMFTLVLNPPGADAKIDEAGAVAAAREFAAGKDERRAYRQLYAASRLLQHGLAYQTVQELSDAAREGVDAAINIPAVTVAVQADELVDIRARAIAAGGTPDIPDAPRNVLANILRGRIEAQSGWALFNLDKTNEAVEHLRRAAGILPAGTPLWQTANWHLGVALQQAGNDTDALAAYIKSYKSGAPDPARRAIIEQLYKKINGSLDGLDDRIGSAAVATTGSPSATPQPDGAAIPPNSVGDTEKGKASLAEPVPTPGPTPTPEPSLAPNVPPPEATPSPTVTPEVTPQPTPTPSNESTPAPTPATEPSLSPSPSPGSANPESTATPQPSPEPPAAPTPTPDVTPTPEPTPAPESTPKETPAPAPSSTPPTDGRPRRVKPPV